MERTSILFLVCGLTFVGFLMWTSPGGRTKKRSEFQPYAEHSSPAPELPHQQIGNACVMSRPVTKTEFTHFIRETGYHTWREREGLTPTWQSGKSSEPVQWLTQVDGQAYCKWLSEKKERVGFRLPTTAELEAIDGAQDWEWTGQSLHDSDPSHERNHNYRTAWHPKKPPLHRRIRDLGATDIPSISFRVAWDLNESS